MCRVSLRPLGAVSGGRRLRGEVGRTVVANTQQFCTFLLQGQLFGVPVQEVREVLQYQGMTRVPLVSEVVRGLINLRGQIVMAVDLRRRLGMEDRSDSRLPMNVVVQTDEGAVSFLVDEIGGVLEADEKDFEQPPETLQGQARELLRGVYKLEGRLMHVLNTQRVCESLERTGTSFSRPGTAEVRQQTAKPNTRADCPVPAGKPV
jgi:purine-binding chemotaxis protein CheW